MGKYTITYGSKKYVGRIEAKNAKEAIEKFSEIEGADSDFGFLRGGLIFDAETRGEKWAVMNSDGGKVTAKAEA